MRALRFLAFADAKIFYDVNQGRYYMEKIIGIVEFLQKNYKSFFH